MEEGTITIKGKKYELVYHQDNSAPHSKCVFYDKWKSSCKFPKIKKKRCTFRDGTSKGWDTYEYSEVLNI